MTDIQWPDPTIDTSYDANALVNADTEQEFVRVAFEMLKQAAGLVALPIQVRAPGTEDGWERNDAILIGHLLRMYRLMIAVIRQVADHHTGDLQVAISRQFIDSAANVVYLLKDDGTGARYDAYVFDSLIAEREMLNEITRNIEGRSGETWAIEHRMKKSIEDTLAAAGVTWDDIPSRRQNNWPTAQERVEELGKVVYATYRTASSAIHGTFTDLEKQYLEHDGDRFQPASQPTPYRPQTLTMMAQMSAFVMSQYMNARTPELWKRYGSGVLPFYDEAHKLDVLHEEYLLRRSTNSEPVPAGTEV